MGSYASILNWTQDTLVAACAAAGPGGTPAAGALNGWVSPKNIIFQPQSGYVFKDRLPGIIIYPVSEIPQEYVGAHLVESGEPGIVIEVACRPEDPEHPYGLVHATAPKKGIATLGETVLSVLKGATNGANLGVDPITGSPNVMSWTGSFRDYGRLKGAEDCYGVSIVIAARLITSS